MRTLMILLCLVCPVWGQGVQMAELSPATTRAIRDVVAQAQKSFPRMPAVRLSSAIADLCGGDGRTSLLTRYCTDQHVIFVAADLSQQVGEVAAAHAVAHQFGHAVQVRHGIADIALARIRAERSREAEYRGWVTRQVACIAGVLLARAGGRLPSQGAERFTGSHWGHSPLSRGPQVSIGAAERHRWLEAGFRSRDFTACSVGDFSADLILDAER